MDGKRHLLHRDQHRCTVIPLIRLVTTRSSTSLTRSVGSSSPHMHTSNRCQGPLIPACVLLICVSSKQVCHQPPPSSTSPSNSPPPCPSLSPITAASQSTLLQPSRFIPIWSPVSPDTGAITHFWPSTSLAPLCRAGRLSPRHHIRRGEILHSCG